MKCPASKFVSMESMERKIWEKHECLRGQWLSGFNICRKQLSSKVYPEIPPNPLKIQLRHQCIDLHMVKLYQSKKSSSKSVCGFWICRQTRASGSVSLLSIGGKTHDVIVSRHPRPMFGLQCSLTDNAQMYAWLKINYSNGCIQLWSQCHCAASECAVKISAVIKILCSTNICSSCKFLTGLSKYRIYTKLIKLLL